ncbi:MAG: hypothetical protein BGO12_03150 [Verrucomicrobia bacterium 61-8]|nr:MAG: hypothetical protein BGO12_03150 [Verrucomicrobia bacterium 61-8]
MEVAIEGAEHRAHAALADVLDELEIVELPARPEILAATRAVNLGKRLLRGDIHQGAATRAGLQQLAWYLFLDRHGLQDGRFGGSFRLRGGFLLGSVGRFRCNFRFR